MSVTTIATVGQWVLVGAVGVFVLTMLALVIYALGKGEPDDADVAPSLQPFGPNVPTGRTGITAYKGRSRLKVVASRRTFIPMASLVRGTATRQEWAVVVGIQIALLSFWLIFVGVGLMLVSSSKGLSLFFPAVTTLWFFGLVKAQWDDLRAERRKLARADGDRGGRHETV